MWALALHFYTHACILIFTRTHTHTHTHAHTHMQTHTHAYTHTHTHTHTHTNTNTCMHTRTHTHTTTTHQHGTTYICEGIDKGKGRGMMGALSLVLLSRAMQSWNQTGVKNYGAPDISKWLLLPHNTNFLYWLSECVRVCMCA